MILSVLVCIKYIFFYLCDINAIGDWFYDNNEYITCVTAIITCAFTMLMYYLVKTQLSEQIKQFGITQKGDAKVREDTKKYIDQIKNQILIDSLASLLEKKHKFIYHFEELLADITDNETFLLRNRKGVKETERLEEIRNYYERVVGCIKNVEYYLGFLNDMIVVMDKNGDNTRKMINIMYNKLAEIKTRDGVADDIEDVDSWIDSLIETKDEIITSIDIFCNNINSKINKFDG